MRAVSWALPWLITLAISTGVAYATTTAIVGSGSIEAPIASTAASVDTVATRAPCTSSDGPMLTYARMSGYIPADYCPTPPS